MEQVNIRQECLDLTELEQFAQNGFLKKTDIFSEEELSQLEEIKSHWFEKFPLGQTDSLEPNREVDTFYGDYPIRHILGQEPRLSHILSSPLIINTIQQFVGQDSVSVSCSMRLVPPNPNKILEVHRDQGGGVSIAILMSDLSENQGNTFFHPRTHLNYPPPRYCDPKSYAQATQITGNFGDLFFWFPDIYHGRVPNLGNNSTTILLCTFENRKSQHRTFTPPINRDIFQEVPKSFKAIVAPTEQLAPKLNNVDKLLRVVGNSPGSAFKRYIYLLIVYRIPYLRRYFNDNDGYYTRRLTSLLAGQDNFSLRTYWKRIDLNICLRLMQKVKSKVISSKF